MTGIETPLIRTRSLTVGYSGRAAAEVPDLEVVGGVVWHVTGPNGSGKTALLKTLAGLLDPISGQIVRRCGRGIHGTIYVHSVPYIFAGTVRRNLALARTDEERVGEVAEEFGLGALLDRDAKTLSHGQQRRLALARALVGRPAVLLVDEPEGGLDDEAISMWRACAVRAAEQGAPALVAAAHRPLAFDGMPMNEIRLEAAGQS
jgi:ABC-type molybdenum transport system ATPase subunit/photorepair protein PhrA